MSVFGTGMSEPGILGSRSIHGLLSLARIFQRAVEDEMIIRNPRDGVKRGQEERHPPRRRHPHPPGRTNHRASGCLLWRGRGICKRAGSFVLETDALTFRSQSFVSNKSPISHFNRARSVSNVRSETFCWPISIRFKDDFEIPSLRANRY